MGSVATARKIGHGFCLAFRGHRAQPRPAMSSEIHVRACRFRRLSHARAAHQLGQCGDGVFERASCYILTRWKYLLLLSASLESMLTAPYEMIMQPVISTGVRHHSGVGRDRLRFMSAAYRLLISA